MAQARPFAVVETGVAEVPRLGPGRQPIARAGGDQLPGERGPGRQPVGMGPGAGPLSAVGVGRVHTGPVGPESPVVIVRASANSSVLNPSTITSLFGVHRFEAGLPAPVLDASVHRSWGRGPAGAVPNQVHGRSARSGDRWDSPGTVARRMYPRSSRRRSAPPDGPRVAMDPASDRVIAGPAAGVGPGEVEEGRQHPQIGGREPGVGGDVVGDGGEGDTRLGLGPHGRTFPVRSAGPRPVWSTGL